MKCELPLFDAFSNLCMLATYCVSATYSCGILVRECQHKNPTATRQQQLGGAICNGNIL